MPARRSPPAMPRSLLANASRRRGGAAPPRRPSSAGAKLACPRSCKSCSVLAVALGRGLPAAPWPALAAARHAPRPLHPCLLDDDDAARRTPPLLAARRRCLVDALLPAGRRPSPSRCAAPRRPAPRAAVSRSPAPWATAPLPRCTAARVRGVCPCRVRERCRACRRPVCAGGRELEKSWAAGCFHRGPENGVEGTVWAVTV